MARRKSAKRRTKKQPIKLLNIAQGIVVGNAITNAFFKTSLLEFATGRINGGFNPGGDGPDHITLPELVGFATRPGGMGVNSTMTTSLQIRNNIMREGAGTALVATLLLAGPAFKLGTKAMAPLLRPINKQLKQTGVVL
jgi:hypothetical protein